jgi:hypothetical protein
MNQEHCAIQQEGIKCMAVLRVLALRNPILMFAMNKSTEISHLCKVENQNNLQKDP